MRSKEALIRDWIRAIIRVWVKLVSMGVMKLISSARFLSKMIRVGAMARCRSSILCPSQKATRLRPSKKGQGRESLKSLSTAATRTNLIMQKVCAWNVIASMAETLAPQRVNIRTECATREVSATSAIAIGTTSNTETKAYT